MDLKPDTIRKTTILIRRKTRKYSAIQIVVEQTQDPLTRELEVPVIFFPVGSVPALIENSELAEDIGKGLIVAAYTAKEWTKSNG